MKAKEIILKLNEIWRYNSNKSYEDFYEKDLLFIKNTLNDFYTKNGHGTIDITDEQFQELKTFLTGMSVSAFDMICGLAEKGIYSPQFILVSKSNKDDDTVEIKRLRSLERIKLNDKLCEYDVYTSANNILFTRAFRTWDEAFTHAKKQVFSCSAYSKKIFRKRENRKPTVKEFIEAFKDDEYAIDIKVRVHKVYDKEVDIVIEEIIIFHGYNYKLIIPSIAKFPLVEGMVKNIDQGRFEISMAGYDTKTEISEEILLLHDLKLDPKKLKPQIEDAITEYNCLIKPDK